MTDRKTQILKRLTDEGIKAAEFLRRLGPEAWEQQVYTTGGHWRVREVLCHFVSAEKTLVYYGRQILAGGPGAPEDFVIDEFNETQVGGMADREPQGLVGEFEEARAETGRLVETMLDGDFDRVGRHPWFGKVPLETMLKLVYRHNMLHIRDVKKALETGQPVPHLDAQPPSDEEGRRK
ncbi:MAG: DinB family protein [Chloroflexi bacterium]|nr:DinB family protein [Chloroflexota bacterium]